MSTWWNEPVRVSVNGSTAINVTSSEKAAELLLGDWPESPRATFAREALVLALEKPDDPGTLYAAQRAFIRAADEAGFLLPDLPKSLAPEGFKPPRWRKRKVR